MGPYVSWGFFAVTLRVLLMGQLCFLPNVSRSEASESEASEEAEESSPGRVASPAIALGRASRFVRRESVTSGRAMPARSALSSRLSVSRLLMRWPMRSLP